MLRQKTLAVEEPVAGHSHTSLPEVHQSSSDTQPLLLHQQEQQQEQQQETQDDRTNKRTRLDLAEEPAPPSPSSSPPIPRGPHYMTGAVSAAAGGGILVRINSSNPSNRGAASARTGPGPSATRPRREVAEVIDLVSSSDEASLGEACGQRAVDVADDVESPGPGQGRTAGVGAGAGRGAGQVALGATHSQRLRPGAANAVPQALPAQQPHLTAAVSLQPRSQQLASTAAASPPPPPQQQQQHDQTDRPDVAQLQQPSNDGGPPAPTTLQQRLELQRQIQDADHPWARQFLHPLLFQPTQFQEVGPDVLAALATFATEWVRDAPLPVLPALMQVPHAGRAGSGGGRGGGGRGRGRGAAEDARVSTLEQLQGWLDRHSAGNTAFDAASSGTAVLDLRGAILRASGQGPHRLRISGSSTSNNDGRCSSGGGGDGGDRAGGSGGGGDTTGSPLPAILICNGAIQGCTTLVVEGGADIAFLDVTFATPTAAQPSPAAAGGAAGAAVAAVGQPQQQQWDALVVVRGKGSRARLKNCTIDMEPTPMTTGKTQDRKAGAAAAPSGPSSSAAAAAAAAGPTGSGGGPVTASRTGCVLALEGGCVELTGRCKLIGGPCFGLAAVGAGAVARAELAASHRAGTIGFLAAWGGNLVAVKCSAEGGGDAAAPRNVLVTHTRVALQGCGFAAVDAGWLTSEQCVAQRCPYAGFLAWGPAAHLASRGGCRAEDNGLAGFLCGQTAVLRVGPKCHAVANRQNGFRADMGGTMTAAERSSAERNGTAGWVALDGSVLVLGRGCRALENRHCGFLALKNTLLFAGEGCLAQGNSGDGWLADVSAQLVAAAGCKAIGNRGRGFAAAGRTPDNCASSLEGGGGGGGSARLVAGRQCVADQNGGEGFAAVQYGSVLLFPGCGATANGLDGYYASNGGRLNAGCEGGSCEARDNLQHGFCAEDPGSLLVAGPGCRSVGNWGWGAVVAGEGAVMRLGASDWQAERNAGGTSGQERGGRLEWVQ